MPSFMRPYATHTYAMLRIVTGFLFLWHGTRCPRPRKFLRS